ncbi:hypothetical protein D3C80_2017600 [compost metagenome]
MLRSESASRQSMVMTFSGSFGNAKRAPITIIASHRPRPISSTECVRLAASVAKRSNRYFWFSRNSFSSA